MIYALLDAYESLQVFLETGGMVLLLIGINIFGMWTLIFERIWFFQIRVLVCYHGKSISSS